MAEAWFQYPIGHGYITQYEGAGTDTPHFADDVETPFHTPLTALLSGTVKQADYATWSGQPGGGEVFIQPDAGGPEYYYYHLDELDVSPGQHVQAGQMVGLSGGQNSGGMHNVSPMWSSGPHTHVGYFTQYTNTPAGSRPYGPDITPLLHDVGGPNGGNLTLFNAGLAQAGGNSDLGATGSILGGLLGGSPGSGPNWQEIGYRVGFVTVGLLLIWLGLKHFLNGSQSITVNVPGSSGSSGESEKEEKSDEEDNSGSESSSGEGTQSQADIDEYNRMVKTSAAADKE